tara:strand:- start:20 stop:487 length:468 start_codon:yes stop_codon:yes gene_type:complete
LDQSGAKGIVITFSIWAMSFGFQSLFNIPQININQGIFNLLLIYFIIDFSITIVWSLKHLPFSKQDVELVTSGPYSWTRHPFYSAFIWSGTGIVFLLSLSWVLLFSVIPISIFWAWHIRDEENFLTQKFGEKYHQYIIKTGQFFPKLKHRENKRK